MVIMRTSLNTLACIPAYNEEGVIGNLVKKIFQYVDKVVVCDDEAAAFLATDKRVNYFLFSGSEKIGWELKSRLENGLKCA